ncbi:MAG: NAD(P)H-quinone oxidoreductase [Candidatus Competibacteraceae bacterium]|uniref:Quinone oxidoreductase n=1 Tax=Candidatus Contendobacter odensis Run_B_J11 TaxID=1400861 RepID=A0A7U7J456_9GAMM|nr:NAD(P)H-quinone oxidoreductase [Candidatus Contendobacter odensis]MBK8534751.1 NAD(P)H-quinone oxidoreductase [Candidatus Competibacteraceae bacterium]MBK8753598.1 NAD(P)H-quinone oxidoreductase [Candidatus Competibacteraceae bacterium]CDH45275.1 Quinone oxidoreductase [Candidatus Contendobacter odensis Run_B_J11]
MHPTLPDLMTAIEITEPGGPEKLVPTRRPLPQPTLGEVLIKVAAAGVNRPDCLQRQGSYPPPPGASDLPGLEVAGSIVALGEGVDTWRVGDEVCALLTGGGYAEYCTAPAQQCLPIPAGLTVQQAAALPETFFTVWSNVFDRARLQPGESLLVHGGASGIGTTAIQLAKTLGSRVFATVGGSEKIQPCLDLGAERVINYREEDFVQAIKAATNGQGVNVILDMVGGDYMQRNLSTLAVEGRLVFIAFLRGATVELNLAPVMMKRLTITGSTLRARPVAHKAPITRALREIVWPLLASGAIRPLIDRVFPLTEAAAAHALMESNSHIGKILLQAN